MRRKIFFVCLFLGIFLKINAQSNLVPNSSFEVHTTCPGSYGYGINYVDQWTGGGTSVDYYHGCATSPFFFSVPSQFGSGFQFSRTGNAYVGLSFYYLSGPPDVRREYLQVKMLDTLVSGQCYSVKFYVSLFNSCRWGVNNVGLNFSTTNFTDSTEQLMNLPMHVFKFGNPIISDTMNWVAVQGIYFAQGNEQYLTIGDFFDNANTDTLMVNNTSINGGYYYVDDVSVTPIDSIPGGMPVFAGNDTTIISGDSVFIGQEIMGLNCNWYIGTTLIADSISGLFVSPTATTTYTVEQNLCGTITYDTVTVNVSGVGINEISSNDTVKIFPNPTTGALSVYVSNNDLEKIHVKIYDILGKQVFTAIQSIIDGSASFNLDLNNGVYFIEVFTQEEKILDEKIIFNR